MIKKRENPFVLNELVDGSTPGAAPYRTTT